jgi:CBS domain-containing protein
MTTVKQILDAKGYQVWTITLDKTVYDALRVMGEREIGALVVMDGDKVAGILSERDYARKVVLKGKTSRETIVRDIMTAPVLSIRLDQSVTECMALMTDKRVRHLPVLDNDKLIGMISLGDLVKSIIDEQQFIIGQLEDYIAR